MKNSFYSTFLYAIPAGVFIGIGGGSSCLCGNNYLGALLFCVGLYAICCGGMNLVTGKAGYLVDEMSLSYFGRLLVMFVGNFIGAVWCAAAIRLASPRIIEATATIVQTRMAQSVMQTFTSGVLCGVLVHFAVWKYRQDGSPLGILLGIPAFILCGFEHCVADMFYFCAAGQLHLGHIGIVAFGNIIGAMATHLFLSKKIS